MNVHPEPSLLIRAIKKKSFRFVAPIVAFFAIVILVYWPALALPLVSDDYPVLRFMQTNDAGNVLRALFNFHNPIFAFYRPLGQTYIYAIYRLIGPCAVFFHIATLTIHTLTSILIALIIQKLLRDRAVAYSTAFIYAAAVAIHLDPLAWATVGIYDVGGAFFFSLSLYLFVCVEQDRVGKRTGSPKSRIDLRLCLSCLAYLIGCLFKEAVLLLPVVLFSASILLVQTKKTLKEIILHYGLQSIPFILIGATILGLKIAGQSPLDYPSTHPYALSLSSWKKNTGQYIDWMFQAIAPFLSSKRFEIIVVLLIMFSLSLAFAFKRRETLYVRRLLFFSIWIMGGLLPVIFLPNHTYRYYATYSLPAFIAMVLLSTKECLLVCKLKTSRADLVISLICMTSLIFSGIYSHRIFHEGIAQKTLADGTNLLISRAGTSKLVQKTVQRAMPIIPDDTVFLIGDLDLWAFNRSTGFQVWYDNPSVHVYELKNLKTKNGLLFIENDISGALGDGDAPVNRSLPDRSKIFAYKLLDNRLIKIDLPQ